VTVNLHRRHLDEFQSAEIGLKWDKIARRIASEGKAASQFTSETGREAIIKRHRGYDGDDEEDGPPLHSSQEIGNEVGVSASTVDRVRTIFEEVRSRYPR
jgi:hypothetical protein